MADVETFVRSIPCEQKLGLTHSVKGLCSEYFVLDTQHFEACIFGQ